MFKRRFIFLFFILILIFILIFPGVILAEHSIQVEVGENGLFFESDLEGLRIEVEEGHEVIVPRGATGSRKGSDCAVASDEMRHSGVRITTLESLLFELLHDAKAPEFKEISALVKCFAICSPSFSCQACSVQTDRLPGRSTLNFLPRAPVSSSTVYATIFLSRLDAR